MPIPLKWHTGVKIPVENRIAVANFRGIFLQNGLNFTPKNSSKVSTAIQCVTRISTPMSHFTGIGMHFGDKHMRISNQVTEIHYNNF